MILAFVRGLLFDGGVAILERSHHRHNEQSSKRRRGREPFSNAESETRHAPRDLTL
jgi:hypothetical protein